MLILTPNRRLAAFLSQQYNQQQVAANKRSWETLEIYPLEAWLSQLWNLLLENSDQDCKSLLGKLQQQIVWEQIIQQSNEGVELLRVSPTAKNAIQAWKFLCQWQVSITKLSAYAEFSIDTAVFYTWLQSYLVWLETNNYSDFNLMLDQLIAGIPSFIDKLPAEICLMGVDDLAPQLQQLFKVLAANNINIRHETMVQPGAMVNKSAFANIETELQAAANWALEHTINNPQQIIGIVIPNLEQVRQQVFRTFTSVLPPQLLNISAPRPLASYSLIDTGLLILQLAKSSIKFSDLSILLRSPFILGAETELDLRAILDRKLRDTVEAKISWVYLNKLVSTVEGGIQQLISTFSDNLALIKGRHRSEHWIQIFETLLASWGWPGDRELTVEEGHLLSCWQDLLHAYCQLSVVVAEHTYTQALQLIQRLASETPFLPAETGLTKVHVLGVLEGSGIYFDQLWVTSMDRDSWPPDAAPNPFIPLELQRQVDMPRSSPQRELKVARRLTETLKQGAKQQVIFSYPQKIADHVTQASNLIANLPLIKVEQHMLNLAPTTYVQLEQLLDQRAPALSETMVKGGATVLKLQAQCPFKAYAELRLTAKELYEPELILAASDRGNLVHEILENFWAQCKDQTRLLAMPATELQQLLATIIAAVLSKLQRKRPNTLNSNYLDLETKRLQDLISRWLDLEKNRSHFTVKHVEQKLLITVGPLSLNLKVDRVDLLDDASDLIIDYKTGNVQINSWTAERIVEPQLPLYTLQYDQTLGALAIASVKANDLSFKGLSEEKNVLPGVRQTNHAWSEQLATWRQNLEQLAADFAQGNAAVDPYSTQVCGQCNLQALCRIYDC